MTDDDDQRREPLPGVANFRDYGGYATASGARIRRGLLYRSGHLGELQAQGHGRLAALDLAGVIDLRHGSERTASPSAWPIGFAATILHAGDAGGQTPHLVAARSAGTPDEARARMAAIYAKLPFTPTFVPALQIYFKALASLSGPSLVHCMAGKDRTGLAVALLHSLMGVHPDDVVGEYLLTNDALTAQALNGSVAKLRKAGSAPVMAPETLQVILSVEPAYLHAAWRVIVERHGSISRYLRDVLEVGDERRAAIERRLIG